MRFIDDKSLERLGFKKLLSRVETLSPYGKSKLKGLKNYLRGEEDLLEEEFNKMETFMEFSSNNRDIVRNVEGIIHRLKDIKTAINNCLKEHILDEVDLFEIKVQALLMEEMNEYLREFPSELHDFLLKDVSRVIKALDPDNDRTPTFYIYESYSPELREIREKKKGIEKEIYASNDFDEITRLKEERLKVLVEEERVELEIKKKLTSILYDEAEDFLENIEKIGNLDFLMAKVRFAKTYGGIRPKISKNYEIDVKGLVNIEVREVLEAKSRPFTPIDISIGSGVTIITGANMGGKSVALKTITENLLLFHMGFFVIAEEAKFPLIDFVFFISDDMQDISKGLSTFGAEIMKLKEVNVFLDLGIGFVVFDEFARGTNPKEGQKFVEALAKYLNDRPTISLMTTHFDGIVREGMNHYQVVGLKNVDFNKLKTKIELSSNSMGLIQEYMDFRLEKAGKEEVPKDALNIAKLIGIDKRFTEIILDKYIKED
jgi:DNA mismatch repair protein MutS2